MTEELSFVKKDMKKKYSVWFSWKIFDEDGLIQGNQEIGVYSSEMEAQKALMDDTMRYREEEGWDFDDYISDFKDDTLIWWEIIEYTRED